MVDTVPLTVAAWAAPPNMQQRVRERKSCFMLVVFLVWFKMNVKWLLMSVKCIVALFDIDALNNVSVFNKYYQP